MSESAARYDFVRHMGETKNIFLTRKDAARAPIDLTGYAAALEIREGEAPRCVLTTANGGILLTGAASGQFEIDPSHALYQALARGVYQYTLMLIPPNGESSALMFGEWKIR